jgi:hypothetical protein
LEAQLRQAMMQTAAMNVPGQKEQPQAMFG